VDVFSSNPITSLIRDDLDKVGGGELIVVFLHKCFPASLTKKEELKSGEGQGMGGEPID
jgi:hypothetical protein